MDGSWQKRWDIIKEILFFFLTTAFVFGWWMLVLLILSFLTLSVLHFTIEGIVIAAVVGTVAYDIYYIVRKIRSIGNR